MSMKRRHLGRIYRLSADEITSMVDEMPLSADELTSIVDEIPLSADKIPPFVDLRRVYAN